MLSKASSLGLASLCVAIFSPSVLAQFPSIPQGMQRIDSKTSPGSYITFKETNICEMTPGVKGYSGYVHLPPNQAAERDYEINTYFWFFEARDNAKDAPLAVWLQGGPGVPSITAALGENGPCILGSDSVTTMNNPWSFNNKANMLYIDQPVQVGFSYDSLVNGTINQLQSPVHVTKQNFTSAAPQGNASYLAGTFSSGSFKNVPNVTAQSTEALWEFMQTWLQEFPGVKPSDDKFSIWSESYGGHYAPAMAAYLDTQNDAIKAGKYPGALPLSLDTVGLINACIDMRVQMPFYPQMAFNNTYDLQRISQAQFDAMNAAWPACEAAIDSCRAVSDASQSPAGTNATVSKLCSAAYDSCFANVHDAYPSTTLYDKFDITKRLPDDAVPKWAAGYLNNASIQAALGVPLNFTGQSEAVAEVFNLTGDFVFGGGMQALANLLDRGSKVALLYGDADYQCNWLGGQAVSLALNATVSPAFHGAGYANISTNASYVGGVVRQAAGLSFSRVFNAGHEIPYYQPETAYRIFERVMFDRDVATGETCMQENPDYASKGKCDVFDIKNKAGPQDPPMCYFWDMLETCTPDQKKMLANGTAVFDNYILKSKN